jgi:hypothetical protein
MPSNGKYTYPPHIDPQRLRIQAARRRRALVNAGCCTYQLGTRAITCLCCGLGSSNPNDIKLRYCGFCKEFHSEWKEGTDDDN